MVTTTTTTIAMAATTTSSSATASCTTAVPGKYGRVPIDACNAYYFFDPSFSANLAFAVLFGMTTMAHLVEAVIFKKRYCWVIIMGGIWECIAFVIKTLGAHDQQELQYAIWGQILFLLAPLWINAFVYMTVARMIYFSLPEKKIWGVRAVRLTLVFIWLDIVCFLVQAAGGMLLSNDGDARITRIGQQVYMAGIGVQMAFLIVFGAMTAWFYYLLIQLEGRNIGRMRFLIWTMLAVLVLVMMRIIYRLIEFGPGVNAENKLLIHEGYPLGLDAFPMLLALALLNIVHPGFVLRGPDSEFPKITRAEKKAVKAQKKEDKKRRKEEKKAQKAGGYVLQKHDSQDSDSERQELMV